MKYTKNQVLHIVDRCFKKWCSDYRNEAEETALEELGEFIVEPPTLRPMSELSESQTFNFVAEIERKDNGYKFHECMERNGYLVQGSHRDFTFFKTDNYENEDFKILGWLYVLPKLNEIKPC